MWRPIDSGRMYGSLESSSGGMRRAAGADRSLGWQTTGVLQIVTIRSAVDERFLSNSALDADRRAGGCLIEKDGERSEDQAVVEKSDLAGRRHDVALSLQVR
jgi:hypothetical protein